MINLRGSGWGWVVVRGEWDVGGGRVYGGLTFPAAGCPVALAVFTSFTRLPKMLPSTNFRCEIQIGQATMDFLYIIKPIIAYSFYSQMIYFEIDFLY